MVAAPLVGAYTLVDMVGGRRRRTRLVFAATALVVAALPLSSVHAHELSGLSSQPVRAGGEDFVAPPPTPRAECGAGSRPAPGLQGRVTAEAPDAGYTCNTELVGHQGTTGGFKVERFVDEAGHRCLYYDTSLIFPFQALEQSIGNGSPGVAVVDVSDPGRPTRTETLVTPAMQSPHESLLVNQKRGLLAAVLGGETTRPGVFDIYDVKGDCRHPQLLASAPVGLLGHESGWAPDGNTFYATSLATGTITAIDVSDPRAPVPVAEFRNPSHGFTVSDDGNRGYAAGLQSGLIVVDTSEIQARKPAPEVREVSRLRWPTLSIPQVALPVRFGGRPHLIEVDEFSVDSDEDILPTSNGRRVGSARIIDISDERAPEVISDIRLEVHQPEHREEIGGDPGAQFIGQGYGAHYCNVPREDNPTLVACASILSGLRVFDIRDLRRPREVAYFVAPPEPGPVLADGGPRSNYAMSKPAFDVDRRIVWYSDINSGLYGVRLTNGAWPSGVSERRLQLSVRPARVTTGCHRFRFRATTQAGSRRREVRSVIVTFGHQRARTNRRGYASMSRCLRRPGRYRARARKSGFRGAAARVRAARIAADPQFTG